MLSLLGEFSGPWFLLPSLVLRSCGSCALSGKQCVWVPGRCGPLGVLGRLVSTCWELTCRKEDNVEEVELRGRTGRRNAEFAKRIFGGREERLASDLLWCWRAGQRVKIAFLIPWQAWSVTFQGERN